MDLSLTRKQQELINKVQKLMQEDIAPSLLSPREPEGFDWSPVQILARHNLVCPIVPKEYGGLGLDRFTTALVMEEIAAGHPGLAAVVAATLHAAEPIILAGSPEQKERFLPNLTGKKACLASFALTESSGGSDLTKMETCAVKKGRAFLINGSKDYIINASIASFISLISATDHTRPKASIRVFIVPGELSGLKIGKRHLTSGLNYAAISEVIFDNTRLDESNVIREDEAGSGYLLLNQTFDRGRAMVAAISVGIARRALEAAIEFAEEREQFGTMIKNHQAVAFTLADMATEIEMARLLYWKAGWLIDQGGDYSTASSMAKLASSHIAQRVTCEAADITGARAYEKGSLLEQLVRDARVLSTIEGTSNINRLLISSQL
ncbi:MAG: acyl-CoA dehydrogenase family protein [Deltaproteobacteria bacterium]